MIDVTIQNKIASFLSSVLGQVSGALEFVEAVDDTQLHLTVGEATHLLNVQQFTFNGQQFDNALQATTYIESCLSD